MLVKAVISISPRHQQRADLLELQGKTSKKPQTFQILKKRPNIQSDKYAITRISTDSVSSLVPVVFVIRANLPDLVQVVLKIPGRVDLDGRRQTKKISETNTDWNKQA